MRAWSATAWSWVSDEVSAWVVPGSGVGCVVGVGSAILGGIARGAGVVGVGGRLRRGDVRSRGCAARPRRGSGRRGCRPRPRRSLRTAMRRVMMAVGGRAGRSGHDHRRDPGGNRRRRHALGHGGDRAVGRPPAAARGTGAGRASDTGPVRQRSLGSEMLRNARTISGSNCPPAQSASSRLAAHTAIGFLYERAAVMVSYASATETILPPERDGPGREPVRVSVAVESLVVFDDRVSPSARASR